MHAWMRMHVRTYARIVYVCMNAWYALVCYGMLWSCMVCYGMQWYAMECYGMLWDAMACYGMYDMVCMYVYVHM